MRTKLLTVALLLAAALAAPSSAGAGFWIWPAGGGDPFAYLGPSTYGDVCLWYYPGSTCSGWNYWAYVAVDKNGQPGSQIHLGFQHSGAIRGTFVTGDAYGQDNVLIQPSQVGWGGWYLKSGATYWSGADSIVSVQSAT